MKAIILIALLALTAQAYLNTTAYHAGFVGELGLTEQQIQDGDKCITAVQDTVKLVKDLVLAAKEQEIEQTIIDATGIYSALKERIQPECETFLVDILEIIPSEVTNTTDFSFERMVIKNFETYAIQIIQQVAMWIEQLSKGEAYEAGATEAYIIQILLSAEKPQVVELPTFNTTEMVPMNLTKFFPEYIKGYFGAMGRNNQTEIDTVAKCVGLYVNATTTLQLLTQNLAVEQDFTQKIDEIRQVVDLVLSVTETCTAAWEIEKPYIVEKWDNFTLENFLHAIFKAALELPMIEQKEFEIAVDIFKGHYEQAGQLKGRIEKLISESF